MSSAVFAITERPPPSRSCIPAASLAPPVPPARTTQRPIPLTAAIINASPPQLRFRGLRESSPEVALRQAHDPDSGVRLVAAVDADQQRRQGLHDAGGLERSGVHGAQSLDQLDQLSDAALVALAVTADENFLVERLIAGQRRSRDAVERGDDGDAR